MGDRKQRLHYAEMLFYQAYVAPIIDVASNRFAGRRAAGRALLDR
jgi:hypothetical protein